MHKVEGGSHSNPRVTFQFEPGEEVFIPEVVEAIGDTLQVNYSEEHPRGHHDLGNDTLSLELGMWRPKGVYEGPSYPSVSIQAPPRGTEGRATRSHFYGIREVEITRNTVRFTQGPDKPQTSLTIYPDGSTVSFTAAHESHQ